MLIDVAEAVRRLKLNQVVAVPTETVYGLAGRASSSEALKEIFAIKERPLFDPLIVHVADVEQARALARVWPEPIAALTAKFWPGPLTVIVPKGSEVNPLITAGLDTVALRFPAHAVARAILDQLGEPFAAPSANRFGRTSPTRAEHVLNEFSSGVPVVDGGSSVGGIESTVIRWVEGRAPRLEILRPGLISRQELGAWLAANYPDIPLSRVESSASPGHLTRHYQPHLPLMIVHGHRTEKSIEVLASELGLPSEEIFPLDLPADARVAARLLYENLHRLSQARKGIIVYWAGSEWRDPSWEALIDRLTRAATKIM